MSIVDKKKKIFGNVAAAKTLVDGIPKLKTNSSFPSINNGGDSISFLTDLIISLIGYDELIKSIENTLTYSLQNIEKDIKKILKDMLNNSVACGINPSIPNFLKSSDVGIVIEVTKIDYLEIFKVNPNSPDGNLLYTDITSPLTNSSDFNTFLFGVIQGDGQTYNWKNIFSITFNSLGNANRPNNTFTIKANSNYDTNKKLTDLNNNFIDSLTLFNSTIVINQIIDIIFGSISVSTKKTIKQLEMEAKINTVIDNLTKSDSETIVSDDYFSFSNEEISANQEKAILRKKGILKLETETNIDATVPVSFLNDFTNEMKITGTLNEQKTVISSNLNKMAEQNTVNSNNPSDHVSIKINFIQEIIKNLIKAIVNIILSPKVVMIFLINFKIVNGNDATFRDPIDFMKQNKNLINGVIKSVTESIVKLLMNMALKKISTLVAEQVSLKLIEKGKNRQTQLLSLVGIPQDVLRKIKGLL